MINLRAIANAVSSTINPNVEVTLRISDGYTIGAGARQVPSYLPDNVGPGQLQALDGEDLKQIANMNVQGSIRALYLYGTMAGVIRPQEKGGDLIFMQDPNDPLITQTWLCVKVLETWPTWSKSAIVLQQPAST